MIIANTYIVLTLCQAFFSEALRGYRNLPRMWVCPEQNKYRDRIWTQAIRLQSLWFQTPWHKAIQFSPLSFHFHCCGSWFFLSTDLKRWDLCLFYTYLSSSVCCSVRVFPCIFCYLSLSFSLLGGKLKGREKRVTVCPPIAFSKLY